MFLALPAPRSLDEDAPHRLGRSSEKMPAAAKALLILSPDKSQIRLMNQGRRLEGLPRLFLSQFGECQLAQLFVNQRQELLGALPIALVNAVQNARHVGHHMSRFDEKMTVPKPPLHRAAIESATTNAQ